MGAGDGRQRATEIGVELGVGVERTFGEHDEVVVPAQVSGEREMVLRELLVLLLREAQLAVVALERRDAQTSGGPWFVADRFGERLRGVAQTGTASAAVSASKNRSYSSLVNGQLM